MKLHHPYLANTLAGLMACLAPPLLPAQTEEAENANVTVEITQTEESSPKNATSARINREVRTTSMPSRFGGGGGSRYGGGGGLGGGSFGGSYGVGGGSLGVLLSDHADTGRSLIYIPSDTDDKIRRQLREDLSIMSHLLRKNIRNEVGSRDEGAVRWDFLSRNQPLRNAYLEGFGALFLVDVNFALSAPPRDETTEKTTADSPPSEWDQARQELFGSAEDPVTLTRRSPGAFLGDPGHEPFDPEKVERLKETIITSLENASNIKSLKPGETVLVVVSGPGAAPAGALDRFVTNTGGELHNTVIVKQLAKSGGSPKASTLKISARASEIQDLTARKISLQEFKKKVQITVE